MPKGGNNLNAYRLRCGLLRADLNDTGFVSLCGSEDRTEIEIVSQNDKCVFAA
jgi:hypothetical protein